jgi:hypothetical protein
MSGPELAVKLLTAALSVFPHLLAAGNSLARAGTGGGHTISLTTVCQEGPPGQNQCGARRRRSQTAPGVLGPAWKRRLFYWAQKCAGLLSGPPMRPLNSPNSPIGRRIGTAGGDALTTSYRRGRRRDASPGRPVQCRRSERTSDLKIIKSNEPSACRARA